MTDYQYTTVPGKLEELLGKIRQTGVPINATYKWLESIGYRSSNDRSLVRVLKFIDFVDESGKPSDLWIKYRGENHQQVLAEGIRRGYADLFDIYPDAYKRSYEELENFFSTKSTAGKQVIGKTVSTFKSLCDLADFESIPQAVAETKTGSTIEVTPQDVEQLSAPRPSAIPQISPALHIDIQIHISSDASSEQIDSIFASMAKHLYKA